MTTAKPKKKTPGGYVLDRVREPSTLAGIAALAVLFGIDASQAGLIVQAIGGLAGLGAVLLPESSSK